MKKLWKKLLCPILALLLLFNTVQPVKAADLPLGWPAAPEIEDETGVLMEVSTGQILFDKGMNEIRYPASTTKIMTALLIIENTPDLNTKVTFTDIIKPDLAPGNSSINAQAGEELTAEQCLYAILLASANEVCTQMAVNVAGSVANFTAMMNQRAAEIGCQNTNFVNANGLPDPNHYTTAYDLALILAEAVKNESFCKIAGTGLYTIPPTNKTAYARNLENHNSLLVTGSEFYYEGAISGKTGHTDAAKNTLVTAATRDNMTLVCVVMRSDGTDRFTDTIKLFDYGFDNFYIDPLYWLNREKPAGYAALPKNLPGSSLTVSDQDMDGLRIRTYSYQGKEIFRASTQLPVETETQVTSDMAMFKTGTQKKSFISPVVFPAMLVIFAGLSIGLIVLIIKNASGNKRKKKTKKGSSAK